MEDSDTVVERSALGVVAVVVSISEDGVGDGVGNGSDSEMEPELIGVFGSNGALDNSTAKLDDVSVEGVIVERLNGVDGVLVASRVMTSN